MRIHPSPLQVTGITALAAILSEGQRGEVDVPPSFPDWPRQGRTPPCAACLALAHPVSVLAAAATFACRIESGRLRPRTQVADSEAESCSAWCWRFCWGFGADQGQARGARGREMERIGRSSRVRTQSCSAGIGATAGRGARTGQGKNAVRVAADRLREVCLAGPVGLGRGARDQQSAAGHPVAPRTGVERRHGRAPGRNRTMHCGSQAHLLRSARLARLRATGSTNAQQGQFAAAYQRDLKVPGASADVPANRIAELHSAQTCPTSAPMPTSCRRS